MGFLLLVLGLSSVLGQDLRETDALCNADGCLAVYFQRRIFLDSWRACKERGGTLATVKRREDADAIAELLSGVDLPPARPRIQVWIGLQRQPRHCAAAHPLRGFSWTTGDQDTQYTNWKGEDSPQTCSVPRCVAVSYGVRDRGDNFLWQDGACSVQVDGYLCHYSYKGMCAPLWSEGAGNALYTTPFGLLSTILTHVPFGSVATVACPAGAAQEQSVLCLLRDDGAVGWSREPPLCSDAPVVDSDPCDGGNGGCDHYCRPAGDRAVCECADGYSLGGDGRACEPADVCHGAPCQFDCLRFPDGYHCACPDGYMLAPDEVSCLDVDECVQSPCEQLCQNLPGTFECRCRDGFHPDGDGGCKDVDECAGNPCEHDCENLEGSHVCLCPMGFSPVPEEPSRCQDIDECRIPGTCEQMCVNYDGGFACDCKEGFELMSNQYLCQEIAKGDRQSGATHKPEQEWDPLSYNWNQEQGHVSWSKEKEQDWTESPRVFVPDVIWVTREPQDELYFDPDITGREEEQRDWLDQGARSTIYDQLPATPSTSTSTTPDWYTDEDEEDEEEATTAPPSLLTSTSSEGAWHWWPTQAASTLRPEPPEDLVTEFSTSTVSGHQTEPTQHGEDSLFPEEESGKNDLETTKPPAAPARFTSPQPPLDGDGLDPVRDDVGQKKDSTWLLVGLLVPICILVVVMVALGIVYCTRCAVQPRNKKTTECYHWISGAHDKQGAPNPSGGVKSPV